MHVAQVKQTFIAYTREHIIYKFQIFFEEFQRIQLHLHLPRIGQLNF